MASESRLQAQIALVAMALKSPGDTLRGLTTWCTQNDGEMG